MNNKENQLHEIYILQSLCDLGMSLDDAISVYAWSIRSEDSLSEAYIQLRKLLKGKNDAQENNEECCKSP